MISSPFFLYIPNRLEIPEFPELSVLPLNILIARVKVDGSAAKFCSALYIPDFTTCRSGPKEVVMDYKNEHDPRFHITITYDKVNDTYEGEKYQGETSKGGAWGRNDWDKFFIHLGLVGLTEGERVIIATMPSNTTRE